MSKDFVLARDMLDAERWVPEGDGSYATPRHIVSNVESSNSLLLVENRERLYALFVNDSDTTIYLALGSPATLNSGIRLNANGGSYEMSLRLGNLYRGQINAIHGGTGIKRLLVTEGV